MNSCNFVGRLVATPELTRDFAEDERIWVRFRIAIDRPIARSRKDRGEKSADFVNFCAFGYDADYVLRQKKGNTLELSGFLNEEKLIVNAYNDKGQQLFDGNVPIKTTMTTFTIMVQSVKCVHQVQNDNDYRPSARTVPVRNAHASTAITSEVESVPAEGLFLPEMLDDPLKPTVLSESEALGV